MTNDEAIEVLMAYLKDATLAWPQEALKKAINALKKQDQSTELKVTMSNAEWCLNKAIPFASIAIGLMPSRVGNYYRIDYINQGTGQRTPIGVFPRTYYGELSQGETTMAFKAWLDVKHEDYKEPEPILTGDERGYLKQMLKPIGKIETIMKHGNALEILSSEYNGFMIPTGELKYSGMEEMKKYKPEDLGVVA